MRIVIDGRMLEWTGIGRYTRHLIEELAALDHTTTYLVLLTAEGRAGFDPPGPNVEPVAADLAPYSLAEQRSLPGLVHTLGPDLVHFTHLNVPRLIRDPYVVTIHDLTMLRFKNVGGTGPAKRLGSEAKYRSLARLTRATARRARHVLVPSRYTAGDVVRTLGVPARTVTVTPEATEVLDRTGTTVRPGALGPDPRPFLLHVGNFYPHKNLATAVRALPDLVATHPDLQLVLAGPVDHFARRLGDQAARLGLGDRVVCTGPVSDPELAWLYDHGALFVLPSHSEGFGLPGLEAMDHGLAVAAARATALPEVYGPAAAYFDPDDPADLARVVGSLLDDPARRADLARAGRARVAGYSWSRLARQTLACYGRAAVAPD